MTGTGTSSTAVEASADDGRPGDRGITVLHVDDEPGVGQLVQAFLERADEDLRVLTATSAREGVVLLERHDVDCVVSDYEMPGTDGLEFGRTVDHRAPEVPFVLFSWRPREAVADDPRAQAIDAHMQKDYDLAKCDPLATVVRNLVESATVDRTDPRASAAGDD